MQLTDTHHNKLGSLEKCDEKRLDKEDKGRISCGWGMWEPSATG